MDHRRLAATIKQDANLDLRVRPSRLNVGSVVFDGHRTITRLSVLAPFLSEPPIPMLPHPP
ncbi:MAG: hypothetical protein P0Y59_04435 [Candidatus Sphingomonas phytovorans]|nr:hypothetical protein [Sphingomonas sp.]WEK00948.1 MAG: hypothetical protein P0Y59_04435 [Sphingomonas sp.]